MSKKNDIKELLHAKSLVESLIAFRKQEKLTQKDLAEKCNLTQSQIAKIENYDGEPKLSTFIKYVEALDLHLGAYQTMDGADQFLLIGYQANSTIGE